MKKIVKTQEGRYNEKRVESVYRQMLNQLNHDELCQIADLLIWDKHYMVKTAGIVAQDWFDLTKRDGDK